MLDNNVNNIIYMINSEVKNIYDSLLLKFDNNTQIVAINLKSIMYNFSPNVRLSNEEMNLLKNSIKILNKYLDDLDRFVSEINYNFNVNKNILEVYNLSKYVFFDICNIKVKLANHVNNLNTLIIKYKQKMFYQISNNPRCKPAKEKLNNEWLIFLFDLYNKYTKLDFFTCNEMFITFKKNYHDMKPKEQDELIYIIDYILGGKALSDLNKIAANFNDYCKKNLEILPIYYSTFLILT